MIVTEFATGSSIESAASYFGDGLPSYGDNNTPTSSAAGQGQYVTNELCMLHGLGIAGYTYFGLYDAATWWELDENQSGAMLAWLGYWGPMSENASLGSGANKPSWAALQSFNPGNCSSGYPPVVAIQTEGGYYASGDPGTFWYTAADTTSLSMDGAQNQSDPYAYSCDPYVSPAYTNLGAPLVGSCAFSSFQTTSTTLTVTGTNSDGGNSPPVQASIVVGPPIVTGIYDDTSGQGCAVTNSTCNINISQTDLLWVFGEGFNPLGGNNIELVNQANPNDVSWFFAGEQHNGTNVLFVEGSPSQRLPGQINVRLDCTISPVGAWGLVVRDNPSGSPSAAVTLNIVQGGC